MSKEQSRKILAPIDFSDLSRRGLETADRMAVERDADLTVLHVHPIVQTAFMDMAYTESPERIAESVRTLETKMAEWVENLKTPPDRISARVVIGMPVEQIEKESADHGILVISTHGRTGLSHFLLGSVAERVVRCAHCAVLVIKKPRES